MKEYYDHRLKKTIVSIDAGETIVSGDDVYLSTVLGPCVAAILWDPVAGIGGMNHFQSSRPKASEVPVDRAAYYGSVAMPKLLGEMEAAGCRRDRLQAKLFGGACIYFCDEGSEAGNIGAGNIAYAQTFLEEAGIPVTRQDVGGRRGRRIYFDVKTFTVYLRKLSEKEYVPQ